MPQPLRLSTLLGAYILLFVVGCCPPIPRQPGPGAAAFADINPTELRAVLSGLARSHEQKMQLVFYVSLPWTGVDPPCRAFYSNMGTVQDTLDREIRAWAKAHDIDLTFRFSDDLLGAAQDAMETRQKNVIFSDNRTDLTRDTLVQMYADYEWQISILQTLLPKVREPELRAYVEHSLKAHLEGSAEIVSLLKRFKGS